MNNGRDVFFSPSFHSVGRKKVVTLRQNGYYVVVFVAVMPPARQIEFGGEKKKEMSISSPFYSASSYIILKLFLLLRLE